jgi:predicted regulator of Ras-like GTPase activity (Roadblock/LC7/MglB family)
MSQDSSTLDNSLERSLLAAARDGFSGKLTVTSETAHLGLVVFHRGRIGWAVSREQPEDLGTFIWRLGRITKDQLQPIRQRYDEHGGKKKLGELLEEAGLIRRPVLRRCLLLHARRALSALIRQVGATGARCEEAVRVDPEMTFALEELLPEFRTDRPQDGDGGAALGANPILVILSEIQGYEASAILSADGEAVVAHSTRPDFDPSLLGVLLVSVLEASSKLTDCTDVGELRFLLLDCEHGSLLARWVPGDRHHLMALLVGESGNIGTAKYEMEAALPAVASYLDWERKQRAR